MNQQQQVATTGKALPVIAQFRRDLSAMEGQFKAALPAHIPVERFMRVVMTAIQNSPKLLQCTRQSLFNACMKAASDGLLPDGREGAIVPFGDQDDGRKKADTASWMPMIAGIRKKARNSGEISDWFADVVHEGDHWRYEKGENPIIEHIPSRGGRKRPVIAAYSICKLKDGTLSREWMWIEEIEEVRNAYSRAKRGPWSDPVAYPEMCKKTVARLHSKVLPMSTDLDDVIRRDDELYDFKKQQGKGDPAPAFDKGSGTSAAIESRAGNGADAALEHFGNGGDDGDADGGDPKAGDGTVIDRDGVVIEPGAAAKARTDFVELLAMAEKKPPTTVETFRGLVMLLTENAQAIGGADGGTLLANFWSGPLARTLRNKANLTKEDTDAIAAELTPAVNEMMADGK